MRKITKSTTIGKQHRKFQTSEDDLSHQPFKLPRINVSTSQRGAPFRDITNVVGSSSSSRNNTFQVNESCPSQDHIIHTSSNKMSDFIDLTDEGFAGVHAQKSMIAQALSSKSFTPEMMTIDPLIINLEEAEDSNPLPSSACDERLPTTHDGTLASSIMDCNPIPSDIEEESENSDDDSTADMEEFCSYSATSGMCPNLNQKKN
ncbi:uncharacterized protein LOC131025805 [Salvia miltiorrhiza]|uniref:uncharacterized protein LOC131025805 n=1 Tax=Salvia miltiorrhiza TaxID=226208 RepID=UPI0025AB6E68|nr:uncharacterized protein LOC131025805 [Salvia miltiorrhiza]